MLATAICSGSSIAPGSRPNSNWPCAITTCISGGPCTLLSSRQTQSAFDLRRRTAGGARAYGPGINATSMLLARRLVEAGVPFVTVFWKGDHDLDQLCRSGGGWDTHGNNFNCLKDHLLPEFDRPFAALLDDLHRRGLLAETLVMVSSEMGRSRTSAIVVRREPGAGRDHWPACMSVLLAGGGIRGGQVYGASDARAEYPHDNPVGPEHIAHDRFSCHGHRRPPCRRPRKPAFPAPR